MGFCYFISCVLTRCKGFVVATGHMPHMPGAVRVGTPLRAAGFATRCTRQCADRAQKAAALPAVGEQQTLAL